MSKRAYFWSPVLFGLGLTFMPGIDSPFAAYVSGSLIIYGIAADRLGGWWY